MVTFFNDLRIKYVGLTGYILKMDLTWAVLDSFIIPEASSRIFGAFSVSMISVGVGCVISCGVGCVM